MNKRFVMAAILVCGMLGLATGCVERTVYVQRAPNEPDGAVLVTEAPPAPPPEVIVVRPGPAFVWVPGWWTWRGRWVWTGGHWVIGPHPRAVWVPGHWHKQGSGYVWARGYWR